MPVGELFKSTNSGFIPDMRGSMRCFYCPCSKGLWYDQSPNGVGGSGVHSSVEKRLTDGEIVTGARDRFGSVWVVEPCHDSLAKRIALLFCNDLCAPKERTRWRGMTR